MMPIRFSSVNTSVDKIPVQPSVSVIMRPEADAFVSTGMTKVQFGSNLDDQAARQKRGIVVVSGVLLALSAWGVGTLVTGGDGSGTDKPPAASASTSSKSGAVKPKFVEVDGHQVLVSDKTISDAACQKAVADWKSTSVFDLNAYSNGDLHLECFKKDGALTVQKITADKFNQAQEALKD